MGCLLSFPTQGIHRGEWQGGTPLQINCFYWQFLVEMIYLHAVCNTIKNTDNLLTHAE